MLRVVVIGYGEMFTNLIAASLDANCNIVGILRKETVKYTPIVKKIKDILNPSKDYNYIKSYNLPEIEGVRSVNSATFRRKLRGLNPDIILVGSWGEKFEKETFDIPKIASINAHPSLLPKYRGPNPYFWVIKNCEQESGISFHLIDKGYDTGAILAQEIVKIYPSDTGESLKQRTVLAARGVCTELLNSLKEDIIIPLSQNEEKSSYYSYPEGLELDFINKTAEENYALVRASFPWEKPYFYHKITALMPDAKRTFIEDNSSQYCKAGMIAETDYNSKTISVICKDGKILKMSNLNLYKKLDRPFTKNYIKLEVQEGDLL